MKQYQFQCDYKDDSFRINVNVDRLPEKINEKWQPITTTIHLPDGFILEEHPEVKSLYIVLGSFYAFGSKSFHRMVTEEPNVVLDDMADKLGKGRLTDLIRGVDWLLVGLWPHTINFGDLCYSTSSEMDIGITWRYFDAFLQRES